MTPHFLTCHHTDSTIRENIHDSTFSNAAVKVPVSCQSSANCIKPLTCLLPEPLFHFTAVDFPSLFLLPPLDPACLARGLEFRELPNAWEMISLSTIVLDNQNVNLYKQKENYVSQL